MTTHTRESYPFLGRYARGFMETEVKESENTYDFEARTADAQKTHFTD